MEQLASVLQNDDTLESVYLESNEIADQGGACSCLEAGLRLPALCRLDLEGAAVSIRVGVNVCFIPRENGALVWRVLV